MQKSLTFLVLFGLCIYVIFKDLSIVFFSEEKVVCIVFPLALCGFSLVQELFELRLILGVNFAKVNELTQ